MSCPRNSKTLHDHYWTLKSPLLTVLSIRRCPECLARLEWSHPAPLPRLVSTCRCSGRPGGPVQPCHPIRLTRRNRLCSSRRRDLTGRRWRLAVASLLPLAHRRLHRRSRPGEVVGCCIGTGRFHAQGCRPIMNHKSLYHYHSLWAISSNQESSSSCPTPAEAYSSADRPSPPCWSAPSLSHSCSSFLFGLVWKSHLLPAASGSVACCCYSADFLNSANLFALVWFDRHILWSLESAYSRAW